jgi:hypothetical protein
MTRRPKLTPDEVDALMIPRIVDALYPVLIPIEQQCIEIQAQNHKRITDIATVVWRSFVGATPPAD